MLIFNGALYHSQGKEGKPSTAFLWESGERTKRFPIFSPGEVKTKTNIRCWISLEFWAKERTKKQSMHVFSFIKPLIKKKIQMVSKLSWQEQVSIAKKCLKQKRNKEELVYRILKNYSTSSNFKGWYWHKNRGKDHWNRIRSPKHTQEFWVWWRWHFILVGKRELIKQMLLRQCTVLGGKWDWDDFYPF